MALAGGMGGAGGAVGFVGGGNMSSAVGRALLSSGLYTPARMWVSGPRLHNLQHWADLGVNVTSKNADVINNCDIIFLGVKPHILVEALKDCDGCISAKCEEKLFVSMLAGVTIKDLVKMLSTLVPQLRVVRTMPNTPMLVGAGACLYTPGPGVTARQCEAVEGILAKCGVYEKVPESMIDSLGTLTGCGPAFMFIIMEALSDGAVKQGVPRDLAIKFAAQMMLGSARMVLETSKHPGKLKDEVCSPGGSTICGVTALENGSIRATLINAMEAATLRNKELGKQ